MTLDGKARERPRDEGTPREIEHQMPKGYRKWPLGRNLMFSLARLPRVFPLAFVICMENAKERESKKGNGKRRSEFPFIFCFLLTRSSLVSYSLSSFLGLSLVILLISNERPRNDQGERE